jgi:RNA polymerase sigma factor (sigma-70 family)
MSGLFSQPVDEAVIAAARAGDRQAQARLYDLFGAAVFTLARRILGRPEPAEDVLQDTFVDVVQQLKNFRGEAPVGMWIRQIAVNKCLMQVRSPWQRLRAHIGDDSPGMSLEEWSQDDGSASQDRLDMERALARLPPESRTVLWLHGVEGYTHQEIARLMGITANTSKSKLARAYKRLRLWALSDTGDGHAPDA